MSDRPVRIVKIRDHPRYQCVKCFKLFKNKEEHGCEDAEFIDLEEKCKQCTLMGSCIYPAYFCPGPTDDPVISFTETEKGEVKLCEFKKIKTDEGEDIGLRTHEFLTGNLDDEDDE